MSVRWTALTLWLVTVGASAAALPRLPATVPVHWGLDGQPDRWGSRWELLLLGPGLLLLVGGLAWAMDRKDPIKNPEDNDGPRLQVLGLAMALLAFLHVVVLAHVGGLLGDLLQSLGLGLAFFWMLMGNVMGRVRPNATTGIRTPWTFKSPEIWRRTHRLAGRLMFFAGLLGALGGLVLPGPALLVTLLGLVLISTLGPAVYSYLLWKKEG